MISNLIYNAVSVREYSRINGRLAPDPSVFLWINELKELGELSKGISVENSTFRRIFYLPKPGYDGRCHNCTKLAKCHSY